MCIRDRMKADENISAEEVKEFDKRIKHIKAVYDEMCIRDRMMGIEPTRSAWKAEVLPLNYIRLSL